MDRLRRFSPPLSLSVSFIEKFVFRFGNDNYRYRYRLSTLFAVIVSTLFEFRYPTLLIVASYITYVMIYDSRQNLAPNHYIPTSSGSTTGTVHGSSSRAEQQRDPPQQSGASSSEADSSSSEAHSSSSSATAARPGNPRRYSYTCLLYTSPSPRD